MTDVFVKDAEDVALDAPVDPPEAPGVRHFVRRSVRQLGINAGKRVDYWSISL